MAFSFHFTNVPSRVSSIWVHITELSLFLMILRLINHFVRLYDRASSKLSKLLIRGIMYGARTAERRGESFIFLGENFGSSAAHDPVSEAKESVSRLQYNSRFIEVEWDRTRYLVTSIEGNYSHKYDDPYVTHVSLALCYWCAQLLSHDSLSKLFPKHGYLWNVRDRVKNFSRAEHANQWKQWESLVAKNPAFDLYFSLAQFSIGLCVAFFITMFAVPKRPSQVVAFFIDVFFSFYLFLFVLPNRLWSKKQFHGDLSLLVLSHVLVGVTFLYLYVLPRLFLISWLSVVHGALFFPCAFFLVFLAFLTRNWDVMPSSRMANFPSLWLIVLLSLVHHFVIFGLPAHKHVSLPLCFGLLNNTIYTWRMSSELNAGTYLMQASLLQTACNLTIFFVLIMFFICQAQGAPSSLQRVYDLCEGKCTQRCNQTYRSRPLSPLRSFVVKYLQAAATLVGFLVSMIACFIFDQHPAPHLAICESAFFWTLFSSIRHFTEIFDNWNARPLLALRDGDHRSDFSWARELASSRSLLTKIVYLATDDGKVVPVEVNVPVLELLVNRFTQG